MVFSRIRNYLKKLEFESEQYDNEPFPGKAITPAKSKIYNFGKTNLKIMKWALPISAIFALGYGAGYFKTRDAYIPIEVRTGEGDAFNFNFDGKPDAFIVFKGGKKIPFYSVDTQHKHIQLFLRDNPHFPKSIYEHDDLVSRAINGDINADREHLSLIPLEVLADYFSVTSERQGIDTKWSEHYAGLARDIRRNLEEEK